MGIEDMKHGTVGNIVAEVFVGLVSDELDTFWLSELPREGESMLRLVSTPSAFDLNFFLRAVPSGSFPLTAENICSGLGEYTFLSFSF
jgi:hypothetical protein